MHINRGLLGWGVFLVALGAEALAVRSGLLDPGLARRALEVWPLILIAIGVDLVLQRTPAAALGTIAVSLVFALMAGALIATTPIAGGGTGFCGGGVSSHDVVPLLPATAPITRGTLTGPATVTIAADCGTVRVDAVDGNDYQLGWQGSERALMPAVDASESSLSLRRNSTGGLDVGSPAVAWTVSLPRVPLLNLDLQLNAGSATVSLDGVRLASLQAKVNAGDAKLDLSGATDTTDIVGTANAGSLSLTLPALPGTLNGALHVNAGTIRLCVPAIAGLRIRVDGEALASDNFAQRGMTKTDNTWTLPNWGMATSRIDIVASANLGTITLNPEDGCG